MNPETCEKTEITDKVEVNDNVIDNNVQQHDGKLQVKFCRLPFC